MTDDPREALRRARAAENRFVGLQALQDPAFTPNPSFESDIMPLGPEFGGPAAAPDDVSRLQSLAPLEAPPEAPPGAGASITGAAGPAPAAKRVYSKGGASALAAMDKDERELQGGKDIGFAAGKLVSTAASAGAGGAGGGLGGGGGAGAGAGASGAAHGASVGGGGGMSTGMSALQDTSFTPNPSFQSEMGGGQSALGTLSKVKRYQDQFGGGERQATGSGDYGRQAESASLLAGAPRRTALARAGMLYPTRLAGPDDYWHTGY